MVGVVRHSGEGGDGKLRIRLRLEVFGKTGLGAVLADIMAYLFDLGAAFHRIAPPSTPACEQRPVAGDDLSEGLEDLIRRKARSGQRCNHAMTVEDFTALERSIAGDATGAERSSTVKKMARNAALGLAAIVTMAGVAQADSTVQVSLWDKGSNMPMVTGLAYGTANLDMSKATMGITATPAVAKAGKVTFKVKNSSKDTIHEMIVMYRGDSKDPLPYITNENRVDEDKAGDKGEVSELDPGASGSLTVDLKPGKYVLICNVPGHFASGMWTEFTVKP